MIMLYIDSVLSVYLGKGGLACGRIISLTSQT